MANVERNAVPVPNEMHKGPRVGHSQGFSSQAPGTHPANDRSKAPIGSSASLNRTMGAVHGSNESNKFSVDNARLGWDSPVAEPGKGSVPVNPFMGHNNGIVPASVLRDSAKR